jgi:phage gp46-like protein
VADARVKRLANLLSRGRQLHWSNAVKIARASFTPREWPHAPPPVVAMVYKSVQLLVATDFMGARGYLEGAALERFGAELFQLVSGKDLPRVHRLAQTYAAHLDNDASFQSVVAADLAAAMIGVAHEGAAQRLSGSPRAIRKTTQLYCAETFNDAAMVRALG